MTEGPEFRVGEELDSTEFGQLTILDVIGRGGMGTVYEAGRGSRRYALKAIHPSLLVNPDVERRFRREADILGRLDNTRVVKIHAYFRSKPQGIPCIVMDRLRGATLAKLARGKNVPLVDICTIASDLLSVLDYVHGLEIVHRDIKPDNIFLRNEGLLTLIDFGVFKDLVEGGDRVDPHYIGTPRYSAYEQLTKGPVSALTDLYAVGVVLYEHLAQGQHPYGAAWNRAVLDPAVAPTPLLDLAPETPRPIAEMIMAAVDRRPERRPPSANVFARPFRRHTKELWRSRATDTGNSSEGDLFSNLVNSPAIQPAPDGRRTGPGPTGTLRVPLEEPRAGAVPLAPTVPPPVPARPSEVSARELVRLMDQKYAQDRAASAIPAAPAEVAERAGDMSTGAAGAVSRSEPHAAVRRIDSGATAAPRIARPTQVEAPSIEGTSATLAAGRRRSVAVVPMVLGLAVAIATVGGMWLGTRRVPTGVSTARSPSPIASAPSGGLPAIPVAPIPRRTVAPLPEIAAPSAPPVPPPPTALATEATPSAAPVRPARAAPVRAAPRRSDPVPDAVESLHTTFGIDDSQVPAPRGQAARKSTGP